MSEAVFSKLVPSDKLGRSILLSLLERNLTSALLQDVSERAQSSEALRWASIRVTEIH